MNLDKSIPYFLLTIEYLPFKCVYFCFLDFSDVVCMEEPHSLVCDPPIVSAQHCKLVVVSERRKGHVADERICTGRKLTCVDTNEEVLGYYCMGCGQWDIMICKLRHSWQRV